MNKIKLQGHEKFSLREGWVSKALQIIPVNANAFVQKESTDLFGIGSNMVKSLRYWMKVLGLTVERGSAGTELSEFGNLVLKYDPYMENPFTLWLMHSNIAHDIESATTWYMYFNRCDIEELEKSEINSILLREIKKYALGQKFSEKSLMVDIDVLLNMYSKNKSYSDPEDKTVSPFSKLGLIKYLDGKYIRSQPSRKIFSENVVLYELMIKFLHCEAVSIEEAIYSENGVAKIYNLSAVMINDYFDKLEASGYIRVDRTAGLDMIYPVKKLSPLSVVEMVYSK